MTKKEKIHEVIIRLVKEWGEHPYNINCGNCEDFALEVQKVIPEVEVYWGDELMDMGFFTEDHEPSYHAFMYYKGKYYDSEELFGVANPAHLPCFQRNFRTFQPKVFYPAPNEAFEYSPEPVFNFVVRSWDV